MQSNRIFAAVGCSVLTLPFGIILTACHQETAPPADGTRVDSTANPVQFVAVSRELIEDQLTLSAKVQADPARSFRVFPPASGRVQGIQVQAGDRVTKGERLGKIESADAGSAQSDFAKAQIEAVRAQRAADREKVLLDHGAVAEKEYVDAKAAADSAQAELARAKQRLAVLGMNAQATAEDIPLRSPSRGVVLSVSAAPGEFSKSLDNADPLMTIADLSTVWIVGDVFEKDIAKVQPGTAVTITVDAFPGQKWTGRITSISGALDPATRTLKARVSLPNPGDKLKPEMFAAIHVDIGKHDAIVVPLSAVIHQGQNTIVFIDSNGRPGQKEVTAGQMADGKVEITSGLENGQRVAANGAELLTGGNSQP
ncbi:MAG: efflux RND transporter periplasmic adaptor subunit [Acidobacteria bacterium]|nr:efflux RND transporter periplasmic adaptor subunit [Acidobacteriota bacterium]